MQNKLKYIITIISIIFVGSIHSYAGNKQRIGQAGASELLINPWARSSALGDANIANISGFESTFINVAGTARLNSMQLVFSNTNWLKGSDTHINSFGISKKIGKKGALSLSIMALDWGEIATTTVVQPNGDGSKFHPVYTNIGISYAKEFSHKIYGGITVKVINESIKNLQATGVTFDAGLQYITGAKEQIKFGVVMKNVGPTLKMTGDGMSARASVDNGPVNTMQNRSAEFELPSLIKLGISYDFELNKTNNVTVMAAFTENSFSKNQYHTGLLYNFKNLLILRAGYIFEENSINSEMRTTALTGFTTGFTLEIPIKKGSDKTFAVDYSYRDTNPFNGVHSIGVRINL
jgi:hypothetical protein